MGEKMIRLNIKDAAIRVLIIESLLDQADNNTASLLSQGIDSEWVENLRSLSSRDALRVSHFQNVTMEVTLNEKQLSHAFAQAADERRVRHLKEYFVRHGASVSMICKMFKMSSKEAKAAKHLLLSEQRLGRPPMPNPYEREDIHESWDKIVKASPTSPVREQLFSLHNIFPSHTLATLWLVINEFEPYTNQGIAKNNQQPAQQETKWDGGSCVHKLANLSKRTTSNIT
jgi:hypothetical protein